MSIIEDILGKVAEIESVESINLVAEAIEARRKELIQIELENFAKQGKLLAKQHGVGSLEELMELAKPRKRGRKDVIPKPPKYRSPYDPNDTFNGQGKRPGIITKYLAESPNNKIEDLLIDKTPQK